MDEQELVNKFIDEYCYFKEIPISPNITASLLPFVETEKVVWLCYKLFCFSKGCLPLLRKDFHKEFLKACFNKGEKFVALDLKTKMADKTLACFSGVRLSWHYHKIEGYEKAKTTEFQSKSATLEENTANFITKHLSFCPKETEKLTIIYNAYKYFMEPFNDFLPSWELVNIAQQHIPQIIEIGKFPNSTLHNAKFSITGIDKEKMMRYITSKRFSEKRPFIV